MADPSKPYDALIVGGGHNGLVCACYLAAGGLRVCVVERRAVVGGAAVTEEFHPGFRNSTASYTVSLLNPKVVRDLRLAEHGLRVVERPFSNFLPLPDGNHIKVGGGLEATQREVARFSKRDAQRLPEYYERLDRVADVLRGLLLETPPNAGGGVHDLFQAWKSARLLHKLPIAAQRDVLDLFTMSAGDWLHRFFESEPRLLLLLRAEERGAWREAFSHYQAEGATFRMNVALSELPDFAALPGREARPHHSSGIIMAPSLAFMERAHASARDNGWSREPIVEMLIPSTVDDSLAPAGMHVASLFCQHFRYALPGRKTWDTDREHASAALIDH